MNTWPLALRPSLFRHAARVLLTGIEHGTPVPDMSGGIAALLGSLAMLIPALMPVMQQYQNYHRERMDQQARGIPPSGIPFPGPPMAQPPLPESGTGLNPHGGPDTP